MGVCNGHWWVGEVWGSVMVTAWWGKVWGSVMVTGGWGQVWSVIVTGGWERCGGL